MGTNKLGGHARANLRSTSPICCGTTGPVPTIRTTGPICGSTTIPAAANGIHVVHTSGCTCGARARDSRRPACCDKEVIQEQEHQEEEGWLLCISCCEWNFCC